MSKTITTLPDFHALIERHASLAVDPLGQLDRAALSRFSERSQAAQDLLSAGVFKPGEDFSAKLVTKWTEVDAADLRLVKGADIRDDALDLIQNNRTSSRRYEATLRAEQGSVFNDVADYARRMAQLENQKEGRKARDAAGMGLARPEARYSTAANDTATSVAASVREEDRARMEAYAAMKRQEALKKYPELQRAYDLQDASNAFRAQHIKDREASANFQKLTDEFIRRKLLSNEALPEIRKLDQEREVAREQERALDLSRQREANIDR